ncbi:MAG: hypothetical protein R3190_08430 [Thermoanaerobaculia bacterium]|nr:hypothetical protein [Thermoanaerobaculia bacterium]
MRIAALLFALLVAMGLVTGYLLLFVEETEIGHGFAHPDYPTMLRGGDGAARHDPVLVGGWLLGTLQIAFMVTILAFGAGQRGRMGVEEWVLVVGGIVFALCFLFTVTTYVHYARAGGGELALSFPIPSAWMLYGIWGAPVIFIVLYMVRFESWILSDEALESFLSEVRDEQDR